MFRDRAEAGEKLADRLGQYKGQETIVLAIPRGGLLVAVPIIKQIHCHWDLIIPRKLGAPHNPEFAIGAVSVDGTYYLQEDYVKMLGVPQAYIDQEVKEQTREIKRRMEKYRGKSEPPEVKNRRVIIVDDGIATGLTVLAAIKSIQNQNAAKTVIAVPVGPPDSIEKLRTFADEVVCLATPEPFYAVSEHYENFQQVEDDEVFALLTELKGIGRV
ncbi:MAG: phosphoribosyltransferase [Firmicutes bacterium]|nr:phosphoribosyltransferase [Bacillota bacterium]